MPDSPARTCPKCATAIPASFPEGLCPKCLLEQAAPDAPVAGETQLPTLADLDASENTIPVAPPVSGSTPVRLTGVPSLDMLRRIFPDLEILDVLGAGGMGSVYKARQPRLNRLIALKIMVAAPGHEADFALRFEREAQVLARLSHPHIVILYDFGELGPQRTGADPLFYFLMEYVDGTDLGQLIKSKELKPTQALAIVPQICEALQYAHDQGITHRDIKPANILIDKRGVVKIADFGLAKMITGTEESLMTGLTQTGTAMGTPHYMAPEQWEHPQQVDHRADIYALGVVFYEMLTGERPAGVFEPPSKKTKPPVDKKLDGVVMRAMDKNPDRRYQQAGQIGDDVTRISGANKSRPATAKGASEPKRSPLKPMLAVGAAAALAVGGWMLWQGEPTAAVTSKTVPGGTNAPPSAPAPPQAAWVPMYRQTAELAPLFGKPQALYPDFQSHAALVQDPASGLKLADGWLMPTTTTHVKLPLPSARNAGVRMRVQMSEPTVIASIWLRGVDRGAVYAASWRGINRYFSTASKAAEFLAERKNFVAKKPGESFTLEFYAIGQDLICRYDGEVIRVREPGEDPAIGTLNHLMIRNPVTDIEFINLDGLSEAEALKLAGVDSVVPITAAVTPPASKSSPYPAGQWVPLIRTLEDVPEHVRSKFSLSADGHWIIPQNSQDFRIPDLHGRDWGMKAVFRRDGPRFSHLLLRVQGTPDEREDYRHGLVDPKGVSQVAHFRKLGFADSKTSRGISSKDAPAPLPDGAEYTLEFYAIGSRLIGRLNGKLLHQVEDSALNEGTVGLYVGEAFRDVEVISLDGLSEADALKLAGVNSSVPPPKALGGPSALHSKPGRLRAAGTTASGKPHDLAKFAAHDDFVDVAGGWGRWVALRANGQTVSSDGRADFADIVKIAASFNSEYAFITSAGRLVIPDYEAWTLPSSLEQGVVDAALGMQHGIALLEGGRAVVFGARYEGVVGDLVQAFGYGTPRWPMPEARALEKVRAVAATVTHAATLHEDGTLSLWGWEGSLKWQADPRQKKLLQLRSTEDGFWALDESGQLWHLTVPRNPAPGQPVHVTGKPALSEAGVTHLRSRCWRRKNGDWAAHISTKDGMALMKEAGITENTSFSLNGGTFDGKPFASLLWIEPGAPAPSLPVSPSSLTAPTLTGRLRGAGFHLDGKPLDLKNAEGITDFVQVILTDRGWVGLRANGEQVTPEGGWSERNIARLLPSWFNSYGMIDREGRLSIQRPGSEGVKAVPEEVQRIGVVDACWDGDGGQAIALLRDGSVRVWGEHYTTGYKDTPV